LNVQGGDTRLGNLQVTGIISGGNPIGGNPASIQGYGTGGSQGVFAFKYDKENFGDQPTAPFRFGTLRKSLRHLLSIIPSITKNI
jgi:hypothetical protein